MTNQQKQDWNNLYEYVKTEILHYDKEQALSKMTVLKLRGLAEGKCIANKNTEKKADYTYEIILYTFKVCKSKIDYAIQTKTFENEEKKISYIMAIVSNNINDVYNRVTNAKKSQIKTENVNLDTQTHDSAEFTGKEHKENERLKDLW